MRSFGLDIRGENHVKMFGLYYLEPGKFYTERFDLDKDLEYKVLYLNGSQIENCKFFAPSASYNRQTLEECLNGSPSVSSEDKKDKAPAEGSAAPQKGEPEVREEGVHPQEVLQQEGPSLGQRDKPGGYFTVEQIEKFGLLSEIQEDSLNVFLTYIYHFLRQIDDQLKNNQIDEKIISEFKLLCIDINDCSKGIGFHKMGKSHMAYFIEIVGALQPSDFIPMSKANDSGMSGVTEEELIFVFQGQKGNLQLEKQLKIMEEKKVKKNCNQFDSC